MAPGWGKNAPSTKILTGTVKSWNGSNGYGFITSPQIHGDILFSRHELPEDAREVRGKFLDGRTVHFDVQTGTEGRPKATRVAIVAGAGEQLAGQIKSYSERHGYGFITSSSLSEDVRFQRTDVPGGITNGNLAGSLVVFDAQQLPDGKMRVGKLMFQSKMIAQKVGGAGMVAAGNFPRSGGIGMGMGMSLPMAGTVKSFNTSKGYGFINAPGHTMDIKFGRNDLQGVTELSSGDAVEFMPQQSHDGRMQATQVTPQVGMKRRGVHVPGLYGPSAKQRRIVIQPSTVNESMVNEEVSGMIKTYNTSKGYGFITCPGSGDDVFFMKKDLPAEVQSMNLIGNSVSFVLTQAQDGRLRASNLTVA